MPVMDGHELLRRVRADEQYRRLPVIMFTQSSSPEDQIEAKSSGADIYLSKPVSSNELLETVNRFVRYNGTRPLPPLPPLDLDRLRPLMDNDEAELEGFLAEALPIFKKESAQQLQLLEEAIHEGNWEEIYQISHSFKGSSGSLGASQLAKLCFEMELAATESTVESLPRKFIEIQVEVARIRIYTDTKFPEASPFY